MDKVPESAAVNEAVNITKRSKDKFAAGFVNAVLRAFLRQIPELPSGDTDYALSIRYSCAKWYIHELKQMNQIVSDDIKAGDSLTIVYFAEQPMAY